MSCEKFGEKRFQAKAGNPKKVDYKNSWSKNDVFKIEILRKFVL